MSPSKGFDEQSDDTKESFSAGETDDGEQSSNESPERRYPVLSKEAKVRAWKLVKSLKKRNLLRPKSQD